MNKSISVYANWKKILNLYDRQSSMDDNKSNMRNANIAYRKIQSKRFSILFCSLFNRVVDLIELLRSIGVSHIIYDPINQCKRE